MTELVKGRPDIRPVAFSFLESLRASGRVNMFGAAPVLADAFAISKQDARVILKAWMRSYNQAEGK